VRFWPLGRTEAAVRKYCNNDAMCVVLRRPTKIKNFNTMVSFWQRTLALHLTELSKIFQAGCFDFAQMKASVELCINKLSDAAAISEL